MEIDIRPVTEPWDIGMARRRRTSGTRRYMVLRKATASTEAGEAPSSAKRAELSALMDRPPAAECASSQKRCVRAERPAVQELPQRRQR